MFQGLAPNFQCRLHSRRNASSIEIPLTWLYAKSGLQHSTNLISAIVFVDIKLLITFLFQG